MPPTSPPNPPSTLEGSATRGRAPRRRRIGRPRLPARERREIVVGAFVTAAEHAAIRARAKTLGLSVSELIRATVFAHRIKIVPTANREVWGRLGLLAANLNQYVKAIHQGQVGDTPLALLEQLRIAVAALREQLLGHEP